MCVMCIYLTNGVIMYCIKTNLTTELEIDRLVNSIIVIFNGFRVLNYLLI